MSRTDKAAAAERDVLEKIRAMSAADRKIAEGIHAAVTEAAPELAPKLWYGQPAWALRGRVVCFFRSGHDDRERYSTFGFTPLARLDDDSGLWPTSYAVPELNAAAKRTIAVLVRQAVG